MSRPQFELFSAGPDRSAGPAPPAGLLYRAGLIDAALEAALLEDVRALPFKEFEYLGFLGKRRVVSFGWSYDFAREAIGPAPPIPSFLLPLRTLAATFAGLPEVSLEQASVLEYGPGAAIGWHRDRGAFGQVIGVSLLSTCRFRLRRRVGPGAWERHTFVAEPRSAYVLRGPARSEWEHSVPPVESLRYAVTFRQRG